MKAVIHIGTEKTGTTSIQEFLHQNRENLLKQGIAYLKSPGLRNQRKLVVYSMDDNHVDNYIRLHDLIDVSKRESWKREFLNEFREELGQLASSVEKVIFSSEHFHSRLDSLEEVSNLKNMLSEFFSDFEIILYIRRQDQLALSLYSTKLKSGFSGDRIFPNKVKAENSYYNYENLLQLWQTVFGKERIKIGIFEKEKLKQNDLITDFLDLAGISDDGRFKPVLPLNEKMSPKAQYLLRRFNEKYPRFNGDKVNSVNEKLRPEIVNMLEKRYSEGEFMPSVSEVERFYRQFEQSNLEVSRQFFSGVPLFSEDFSKYPVEEQRIVCDAEEVNKFFADVRRRRFRVILGMLKSKLVSVLKLKNGDS